MPVGTGSIKRAASKAGTAAKTSAASKKTAAAKKTSSQTVETTSVKASTIASVSPEVVEKMQLGRKQFCHLTEELPVHLL